MRCGAAETIIMWPFGVVAILILFYDFPGPTLVVSQLSSISVIDTSLQIPLVRRWARSVQNSRLSLPHHSGAPAGAGPLLLLLLHLLLHQVDRALHCSLQGGRSVPVSDWRHQDGCHGLHLAALDGDDPVRGAWVVDSSLADLDVRSAGNDQSQR